MEDTFFRVLNVFKAKLLAQYCRNVLNYTAVLYYTAGLYFTTALICTTVLLSVTQ